MRAGWKWWGIGMVTATIGSAVDDWKGIVTFCVVTYFIPRDALWGGGD